MPVLQTLENLANELEQVANTIRKSLPSVREAHRVINALESGHKTSISPENAGVTLIRKIWNAGPGECILLTQEEMDLLRRTKNYDRIYGGSAEDCTDKAVPPTSPSRGRQG